MVSDHKPDIVVVLEPRFNGERARSTIWKLGFNHSITSEARGFSGGIWILWKHDDITLKWSALCGGKIILCCSDGMMFFVHVVDMQGYRFVMQRASPSWLLWFLEARVNYVAEVCISIFAGYTNVSSTLLILHHLL